MLDPDAITQKQKELAVHRRRLKHLFEQYNTLEAYTPPHIAIEVERDQAAIREIKAQLRASNVDIEDHPNDECPIQIAPPVSQALHQLRAPVADFVGREQEIGQLVQALSKANGAAAAISGVRGMGGIGKTELAYVVANRLKDTFPDAQIVVELRSASSNPLTPEQALQTVIRAFEREAKLPDDLGQLQALYRSVLTGKLVLILADDAKDASQVRPLLPPPGSVLLVTSRNRFSLPGMATLNLPTLPPQQAEQLLLEICPLLEEHSGTLAKLCGYLPLALRVSAGLLQENDTRDVGRYLEQLRIERFKHLSDPDNPDDPQASVEASLRLTYDALEPTAQSVLCQISVFPVSFDEEAAQTLVEDAGNVSEIFEVLRRRSLLDWEPATKRYALHELIRAFAKTQLVDADQAAVILRYARYFAKVAERAENLYEQGGEQSQAGLALFDQERSNIDAAWVWALRNAGNQVADALLLNYASATAHIGDLRYDKLRARIPQFEAALSAARRYALREAEGLCAGILGAAYLDVGDMRRAIEYIEQHLHIAREIGDRHQESMALGNLGIAYKNVGEIQTAVTYQEQALQINRELGNRHEESNGLTNLGLAYAALGQTKQAVDCYEAALTIDRELGNLRGESADLGNLGSLYADLGEVRKGILYHEQQLAIARQIGDRHGESTVLGNLGVDYLRLGELHRAAEYCEQARTIAHEIGDEGNESRSLWNLGYVLERWGQADRAIIVMQAYVDYLRKIGHVDAEKRASYLERLRHRLAADLSTTASEKPNET